MTRELYSKTKLAAELGVDRRTLDKRLEDMPPAKEGARNAKLYYLKDVFNAFMAAAEADAMKSRRAVTPEDKADAADEMASAKLRQALADAEMAEVKLALLRGDLVEAERVEAVWANLATAFRGRLLSLPSRAALQTSGLSVKDVERRLDDMIHEALDELSRGDEDQDEIEEDNGILIDTD